MNAAPKGKIGRLPKAIQEQVNRRLENGERGRSLVAWLNALPEVQAVLAAERRHDAKVPQHDGSGIGFGVQVQASLRDAARRGWALFRGLKPHGYLREVAPRLAEKREMVIEIKLQTSGMEMVGWVFVGRLARSVAMVSAVQATSPPQPSPTFRMEGRELFCGGGYPGPPLADSL